MNPVHGEEEIRFVLQDTFEFLDEEGEQFMQEGAFESEDFISHMGVLR